ncbi:MAG: metallophosphoesterase [Bacteroidales bacterium]
MILLFAALLISEILTIFVFRHHYKGVSRTKSYLSLIVNGILSIYIWIIYIEIEFYTGMIDDPNYVWLIMCLHGAIASILAPRILLDILHFSGRLLTRNDKKRRTLTNTGIFAWIILFFIILGGTVSGRFNFKTEVVTVKVNGLPADLEGFRIAQISDLHMSGFHRHQHKLEEAMKIVNSNKPDILINSGDFVTVSYREYGNNDTILRKANGTLGNFAVLGNHDIGTYHPEYGKTEIDSNIRRMNSLIARSGYRVLNDEGTIIRKGSATVGIAGIITMGRYPDIVHGDLSRALADIDSTDVKILISHDPNHWMKMVAGKTDIDLTLAGHTHGMQLGIYKGPLKWSPSKYFYPEWAGLYTRGDQYLYVNRGLGVLSIPLRIGMPPEITVIVLTGK